MEIHLVDDLYLRSDPRCLMISKKLQGKSEKGDDLFTNLKYYHTMPELLKGLLDMQINLSDAATLTELVEDYKKNVEEIKNIAEGLDLLL